MKGIPSLSISSSLSSLNALQRMRDEQERQRRASEQKKYDELAGKDSTVYSPAEAQKRYEEMTGQGVSKMAQPVLQKRYGPQGRDPRGTPGTTPGTVGPVIPPKPPMTPMQRQDELIKLYGSANPETAKNMKESEMARLQREKERLIGQQLGTERFGTTDYAAEHMGQLQRLREQMNLGTLAPELQAARSSRLAGLQRQEAMQQRQARAQAAQAGIRGGAVANRLAGVYGNMALNRQEQERQMFQEDIAQKEAARKGYADYMGRMQLGQLASEAGEQSMGIAERTAASQRDAAAMAAQAARSATGGKK